MATATERVHVAAVVPAVPYRAWQAWLDSHEHASFSGAPAWILPEPAPFVTLGGHVWGRNDRLIAGVLIEQRWRTANFPSHLPSSSVSVGFLASSAGARIDVDHRGLPPGRAGCYAAFWRELFLPRLRDYFVRIRPELGLAPVPPTLLGAMRRSVRRMARRSSLGFERRRAARARRGELTNAQFTLVSTRSSFLPMNR
jgi:hypothetical protein